MQLLIGCKSRAWHSARSGIRECMRHAGVHAIHSASPGLYLYAEDPKIILDCISESDLELLGFKKETP